MKIKIITQFKDWMEENLRRLCGRLTPEKRLITIICMSLIFGVTFIWMFVSSIYDIGRNDGAKMQIDHIAQPELLRHNDSINQLKFNQYEQRSTDDGE